MNETKDNVRKTGKVIKSTVGFILGAIALLIVICSILHIHIFTCCLTEDVARVDCVKGYYVAAYNIDVCYHDGGLSIGYADNIHDYDWKHEELLGIVPYRRILCFSRETEPEIYFLTDKSGTVKHYGIMYVLRTTDDIHYYYRRGFSQTGLEWSSILNNEKISFSYGDTTYELKDFSHFTADIDFTKNEQILKIGNEPCYFTSPK